MRLLLLISLAALMACAACSGEKDADSAKASGDQTPSDSLSYRDLYHQAAVEMVGRFSRDLRMSLLTAIKDSGSAAGAINFCRFKSPELISTHSTQGWSIRRVTDRPRNPANLVSTQQADILARFAEETQAPAFVEEWTGAGTDLQYHFYVPIRTVPFCLNCHGDAASLATGVTSALDSLYPDDKARGYKNDQLRGMFVVEAAYPQGLDAAKALVSDRDNL